jgi:hypothetical protein
MYFESPSQALAGIGHRPFQNRSSCPSGYSKGRCRSARGLPSSHGVGDCAGPSVGREFRLSLVLHSVNSGCVHGSKVLWGALIGALLGGALMLPIGS